MDDKKMTEAMARLDGIRFDETRQGGAVFKYIKEGQGINSLPAYLTSHDAVQRVVDGFGEDDSYIFASNLCQILGIDNLMCDWSMDAIAQMLKATPRQKVEAILKAKGDWNDG